MATLNDFLPDIESEVPGCGVPSILRQIRQAIRDLCTKTRWWQADLATALTLVADTPTYTLTPPANAEVVLPVKLSIADEMPELTLRTREWLDRYRPGWDKAGATTQRVPSEWFLDSPTLVRLVPTPNAESVVDGLVVVVRAALMPARDATTVDDRFLQAEQAVRAGALMRLLDTEQPWGNVKRARDEEQRFINYVAEYRLAVMTGGGDAILTAQTGSFGAWDSRGR